MKPQIPLAIWLNLKGETRHALVEMFQIPRSGFASVQDNRLISDGHSEEDISCMTVSRLQTALRRYPWDSDETARFSYDIFILFGALVDKIEGKPREPKKKAGRPKGAKTVNFNKPHKSKQNEQKNATGTKEEFEQGGDNEGHETEGRNPEETKDSQERPISPTTR